LVITNDLENSFTGSYEPYNENLIKELFCAIKKTLSMLTNI